MISAGCMRFSDPALALHGKPKAFITTAHDPTIMPHKTFNQKHCDSTNYVSLPIQIKSLRLFKTDGISNSVSLLLKHNLLL